MCKGFFLLSGFLLRMILSLSNIRKNGGEKSPPSLQMAVTTNFEAAIP